MYTKWTHLGLAVCLSVRMIQLDNHWINLDEIWYEHYAIGVYP
jgi:hypothetical protein